MAEAKTPKNLFFAWEAVEVVDGSRVQAEGQIERSEGGASPQRLERPSDAANCPSASPVDGCVDFGISLPCYFGRPKVDRLLRRRSTRSENAFHLTADHPLNATVVDGQSCDRANVFNQPYPYDAGFRRSEFPLAGLSRPS
jgi:hypothetical protein